MKILVLSDHESKSLYEYYSPEKLKDIDLIISCGDLRANYLTFFLQHFPMPRSFMSGEITMAGMRMARQRAAPALKMIL